MTIDTVLEKLGLMALARHNYEMSVMKGKIAESYDSYIKEAYAERDELIEENERVARTTDANRNELKWHMQHENELTDLMRNMYTAACDGDADKVRKLYVDYWESDDDL